MKIKGITFIEGLQLLFIAYKLAGVIDWPWWCVLSPLVIKWVLRAIIDTVETVEKKRNAKKRNAKQ